jgi:hydroxymethylglutaryl-CoA lyase
LQVFLSLKIYGANKIIECPRDAMQGIKPFIPTERKVAYIQSLLRVGFDSIDFGSFVSPKRFRKCRIPLLCLGNWICRKQKSKLLAIIANTRGAQMASEHAEINT